MIKKILLLMLLFALPVLAQQPQSSTAPLQPYNAKYVDGVGLGYWPTPGSGLMLNVAAGTVFCSGTVRTYSGGTLSMSNNTTNNVYLNTGSSCAPATKTGSLTTSDIPIAVVVTSGGNISSVTDVRTMFNNSGGGGGGSAFPLTVSGTVNSGGIPCFNSTTNEESSAALTSGQFVLGGGAGACVSAANLSGDATTSGSAAVTVVKVNGGAVPASAALVATNSSSQPIAVTGTQYSLLDWATSSTLGSACTPPATVGIFVVEYQNPTAAATAPGCPQAGAATRSISGATSTDTVLASDTTGTIIDHDIAGSQAVTETIPTPTTLANANPIFLYTNHSATTDTIKATTWTIQQGTAAAVAGATGITIPPGVSARFTVDPFNATQWLADEGTPGGGVGYGAGAGSVNVMTVTTNPAIVTNAAGTLVEVLPNLANTTTTPTLQVGGAVAMTIVKGPGQTALVAGDYNTTTNAIFLSSGTQWQLLNPLNTIFTSLSTGTAPCNNLVIGTAGALCSNEGTTPTGTLTAYDVFWANSSLHCFDAFFNNSDLGCVRTTTNGGTYPITIVSGVSGGIPYFSSTTAESASGILNANIVVKGGGAGAAPTNSSITDDGKNITSAEVAVLGNKVFVTADFTDSTTNTLQVITGLSWTLPTSKAVNVSFHCALLFDQATAAVSDSFGIGVTGTAPTQANASGTVWTAAAVGATGTLAGLASTTPTAVVTFTPSAITTIWKAELDGTIEQPSNATPGVFNIYASTSTGGDNLIVKRGSYCSLF